MLLERDTAWRWRDGALGDVEFLTAQYVSQVFAPHTHEGYAFGVIEGGVETFWYRGANRIAVPGQLIALNPDELHTGSAACGAGGWAYRMLYPPADLVERAARDLAGLRGMPTFASPVITDDAMAGAVRRFHRAVEARAGGLAEASGLVEILALLAQRHARECKTPRRTTRDDRIALGVEEYLEAHFEHNVTLSELSAHVGVSPFHLARRFRAARGIPPHRYLEQLRVHKARNLILEGDALSQAAARSGFHDQAQMTRHFRRHFGVTPGRYRDAIGHQSKVRQDKSETRGE